MRLCGTGTLRDLMGGGVPLASNLNYESGDVIPNLTAVAVANDGRFRLYSGSGGTHLLFDLAGWFAR